MKLPVYANHENAKPQNTNLKQISMTEIQNSKQLRMTERHPISD
jgi:hypothetical protein